MNHFIESEGASTRTGKAYIKDLYMEITIDIFKHRKVWLEPALENLLISKISANSEAKRVLALNGILTIKDLAVISTTNISMPITPQGQTKANIDKLREEAGRILRERPMFHKVKELAEDYGGYSARHFNQSKIKLICDAIERNDFTLCQGISLKDVTSYDWRNAAPEVGAKEFGKLMFLLDLLTKAEFKEFSRQLTADIDRWAQLKDDKTGKYNFLPREAVIGTFTFLFSDVMLDLQYRLQEASDALNTGSEIPRAKSKLQKKIENREVGEWFFDCRKRDLESYQHHKISNLFQHNEKGRKGGKGNGKKTRSTPYGSREEDDNRDEDPKPTKGKGKGGKAALFDVKPEDRESWKPNGMSADQIKEDEESRKKTQIEFDKKIGKNTTPSIQALIDFNRESKDHDNLHVRQYRTTNGRKFAITRFDSKHGEKSGFCPVHGFCGHSWQECAEAKKPYKFLQSVSHNM